MLVDLGPASKLSKRRVQCVRVRQQSFVLLFHENRFYAMDNECPHKSASLCEAELSGDNLVCPWHGARFDIKNGRCSGPLMVKDIKIWPVSNEQGRVIINLSG